MALSGFAMNPAPTIPLCTGICALCGLTLVLLYLDWWKKNHK